MGTCAHGERDGCFYYHPDDDTSGNDSAETMHGHFDCE